MHLLLCGCAVHPAADIRPSSRAAPVQAEGVSNLFRVTSTLYRGDQPADSGMRELRKPGIRTVINPRSFHSDRDEIGDTGLQRQHIFVKSWHPEQEEAVTFLLPATDPTNLPVFVHCQHGGDRTGAL